MTPLFGVFVGVGFALLYVYKTLGNIYQILHYLSKYNRVKSRAESRAESKAEQRAESIA